MLPVLFAALLAPAWFEGLVVPREETAVRIPSAEVELAGARTPARPLAVVELVLDGARVAQGDRLAVLGFDDTALAAAVQSRIEAAERGRERELHAIEEKIRTLEDRRALSALQAEKAKLETRKLKVLSRRDAELVELQATQADFEVAALDRLLAAEREILAAAQAYQAERVREAEALRAELEEIRGRFVLRAPHAGRVYLCAIGEGARRVRMGDRLAAEAPLLRLVRTDLWRVELEVPEAAGFAVGQKLSVENPLSGRDASATITRVSPFPSRGGVLALTADLEGDLGELRPAQVVRVTP